MTEAAITGFESAAEAVEANRQTSYEYLRDEAPFVPARERMMLQNLDNRRTRVRQEYTDVDANEDLVEEARERQKDEIYERNRVHIESKGQQIKDGLLSAASFLERKAKPWPSGESKDISNDTGRLSLAYSEGERLVRIANKRSENPIFKSAGHGEFLRQKYQEGIDVGGAQGSALCAGVLRAAEELGVSQEEVLDPLRTDAQRQAVDDARRLEALATSVSMDTPKPRRAGRGRLHGGRPPNVLVGERGELTVQARGNRKPAWK
jgi:hypothetical protein